MNIVLFEDDRVDQLHPVTIGRPAYAISCGARRLIDCLSDLGSGPRRGIVRPYLSVIQEIDFPEWHTAQPLAFPCLLLNARLVPSEEMIAALRDLTRVERTGVVWSGSSVAAAWLVPPFRFPLPPPTHFRSCCVDDVHICCRRSKIVSFAVK